MIKRLLQLADSLDSKGMYREADDIDDILSEIENRRVTFTMNDEWQGGWNLGALKEKLTELEESTLSKIEGGTVNYTCEVYGSNGVDLVFYTVGGEVDCDVYINDELQYSAGVDGTIFMLSGDNKLEDMRPIEELVRILGFDFKYEQLNEMDQALNENKLYHINDEGRIEEL